MQSLSISSKAERDLICQDKLAKVNIKVFCDHLTFGFEEEKYRRFYFGQSFKVALAFADDEVGIPVDLQELPGAPIQQGAGRGGTVDG